MGRKLITYGFWYLCVSLLLSLPGWSEETIRVKAFKVEGSTVFSPEELQLVTLPFTDRDLTFTELEQVSQAVTRLYTDRGYTTSGAFIPAQTPQNDTITIQVIEGSLAEIKVNGLKRLHPRYIIDRVNQPPPLNQNRLLQSLQLLQLNPRIQSISSELSPSPIGGQSILEITLTEAPSFSSSLILDNSRSPGVGEFRRQLKLQEQNISGSGDTLSLSYSNTDGSNLYRLSYDLPLNPADGTLSFKFARSNSQILEAPFTALDILANVRTYEIAYRQPLHTTPDRGFALELAFTRSESETALLATPFPLSPGADQEGRTRVTALRFSQEYFQRTATEVLGLRSELSLGVQPFALEANDLPRDSVFALWRGQSQYLQQLAPATELLLGAKMQLASQSLVAIEGFGLGGVATVRGYRQDFLLTDNGIAVTAELRLPIGQFPESKSVLHLVPFADGGWGWNSSATPSPNQLGSVGLGVRWQQGERLTIRLDYGIPLGSSGVNKTGLQQNGIYFSFNWQFL
ncbi:MAG: hemolysin activation/secretion protein [Cyanobacteria bacterium M5B4]|nr:MAG: hemolysin activation/secretion protein [Cyanobacteria bacterium M5B4]